MPSHCSTPSTPAPPPRSLHFAAQTPQGQGVLAALLAHPSCTPALVRQSGFRDRSPLVLSVLTHGSPAIVRQLLAAGANPSESVESMGRASGEQWLWCVRDST